MKESIDFHDEPQESDFSLTLRLRQQLARLGVKVEGWQYLVEPLQDDETEDELYKPYPPEVE